ncbi:MAG TPA: hypothetical protein VGB55_12625, partial [Tepidisphaeraceae bacterium]
MQSIAWHGWRLAVPPTWNPVKVDGDANQGQILLADMHAARLGIRWRKAARRGDAQAWAVKTLRQEIGKLAADEAVPFVMPDNSAWHVSKLYIEPEPPGRDVWVGWSKTSNRVLEVVYHAPRRESILADLILPTLSDTPPGQKQAWAIFDLSCESPANWQLQTYRFNAGDLSLTFRHKRDTAAVRQLAPATLALARLKLDAWLGQQTKAIRKLYHPVTGHADFTLDLPDRSLSGRRGVLNRRRRLFWALTLPKQVIVLGAEDTSRNRLLLGQGTDETIVRQLLTTVG